MMRQTGIALNTPCCCCGDKLVMLTTHVTPPATCLGLITIVSNSNWQPELNKNSSIDGRCKVDRCIVHLALSSTLCPVYLLRTLEVALRSVMAHAL